MHCYWECKLIQPLWKTVWRFLKKLKVEILYDPTIPLLGFHLKKMKTLTRKDICTPMFIAALFTITKIWKQPNCPSTDEWIEIMWYMHTMEYYSAMRKKEILLFVMTWMNLEGIRLSETRQRKTNTVRSQM